ncbi:oxidoreductase, short-chain dehydrogenase/reductase family [Cordyceps fumosorosea ARSEF 2679]|uniref:Oxidoreductase, short-chain dehydrogenase/reductase family n=1 Tax=Cordyceps fumosorosea (strain ARSEF 2679) TaxID=1081104 RepID=A0A168BN80_CORFA|nr:oxidoreductase, short-chain dehydrogenase/reductase family [Cordyceps fumosorosea ARSEF 2679]OAA70333.1 oxidoreductase, short-chain dehydrogenase/reductase family [Cordyceps fumosorosea ARSEF 2679]
MADDSPPPAPKTILITGCSEHGIGAALALRLADQGHRVFATARDLRRVPARLREHPNVTAVTLDVTDAVSARAAAETVRAVTAGRRRPAGLDVLVNNAGAGCTMPLLDLDVDRAKRCHDVNLWGPVRTVQAFADLLIARRGRVVNIGAASGCLYSPWIGAYSSSKSALHTVSETLRMELQPLGVTVACLVTGTVATRFHANEGEFALPAGSRYADILETISLWARGAVGPDQGTVDDYVTQILPDVLGSSRGGKLWRGANSGAAWFASTWLPDYILDKLVVLNHGLDKLTRSILEKKYQ